MPCMAGGVTLLEALVPAVADGALVLDGLLPGVAGGEVLLDGFCVDEETPPPGGVAVGVFTPTPPDGVGG